MRQRRSALSAHLAGARFIAKGIYQFPSTSALIDALKFVRGCASFVAGFAARRPVPATRTWQQNHFLQL